MKGKKIWIATHPEQASNSEVSLTEPTDSHVHIDSHFHGDDDAYVEWKEYIAIEVES